LTSSPETVDISSNISGSDLERQTRNDILVLNKEYNEMCDQCDALDAQHLVLSSQQDATELTLSQICTNVQSARDVLDTLNGQIEERERCWIVLQTLQHVRLLDARNVENENYARQQEDLQDTLRKLEASIETSEASKFELQTNLCSLKQAC